MKYTVEQIEKVLEEAGPIRFGKMVRRLRRVGGKLQIVRKRIKALPQSMRTISKAAARRRAKKVAIKKIAQKKRITRKMLKTKRKAKAMGLKSIKN